MRVVGRQKAIIFFLALGICLVALAVALNVGWILLSLQEAAVLVFGIVFFALIITGLVLNTIFLVREIRRNEQHDLIEYLLDFPLVFVKRDVIGRFEPFVFRFPPKGFRLVQMRTIARQKENV
jgi:hypothetical protein